MNMFLHIHSFFKSVQLLLQPGRRSTPDQLRDVRAALRRVAAAAAAVAVVAAAAGS